MTQTAKVLSRYVVSDDTIPADTNRADVEASLTAPQFESVVVTLANGFTAFAVPSGAQWVLIEFISGVFTYTLKGVTGDTGVKIATGTLPPGPVSMPVNSPSIGLACTGAGVVRVTWL